MDGLFGDGLVDVLCGGDSLEEDLRWGPRPGALVDLVEFVDGLTNCGGTLFKTVEALSSGAFFFSTSVELKTKGAGGGGLAVKLWTQTRPFLGYWPLDIFSSFCYLLWKIRFSLNLLLREIFSAQLWLSYLDYHICDKGDNLLRSKTECVAGRGGEACFRTDA